MRKLKMLTVILFLLSATLSTNAQPGKPEREEKIEKFKIAFITERLDLTVEEAQKFWPVYNQFNNEMKELRKFRKPGADFKEELKNMSDADVEKMIDTEMANRQKEIDLVKKYNAQFKSVLPIKKVAMLYRLEREFQRELLDKLRDRKNDGDGPPPRRR